MSLRIVLVVITFIHACVFVYINSNEKLVSKERMLGYFWYLISLLLILFLGGAFESNINESLNFGWFLIPVICIINLLLRCVGIVFSKIYFYLLKLLKKE